MNHPIYGAIVLGSNSLKLKIIQYHQQQVHVLEDIAMPLPIGNDIFEDFIIKESTIHETLRIIKHFQKAISSYDVALYRAIATSAIETAVNGLVVLDIIQMKTGLHFTVLEESVEKGLIYKSLRDQVVDYSGIRKGSILLSLNSGNCDVSVYHQNKLIKNDEIEIGTKAMKSIIVELAHHSVNYPKEMYHFIKVKASPLQIGIEQKSLKHFVYMGSFARLFRDKWFKGKSRIPKKTFDALYDTCLYEHQGLRTEVEKAGLDWFEFLINVLTIHYLMSWTEATELLVPMVSLRDGIVAEILEEHYGIVQYNIINRDTIHLARAISQRYYCDKSHMRHMEKTAMSIYQVMSHFEGFEKKDEELLRISAILLDIGKYNNAANFPQVTFDRIIQLKLLGLSESDHLLIARVCSQLISRDLMQVSKVKFEGEEAFNTRVNRLSAILGIAYALDISMTQRLLLEDVKLSKDKLKLYVSSHDEMTLEMWYLEKASRMFSQTFDITVQIK